MILRPFLMTLLALIFLRLTSASSYSSWDPATTSFHSKTNDQSKKRLKSGMSERISQLGGNSMPNSMLFSEEDDGNINSIRIGHESKYVDPDFRTQDYENQYKDEPVRHVTGGHHNNRNNYYKKNMHDNFAHEVQVPFKNHKERLRRKLEDAKSNSTQQSNTTVQYNTSVEVHLIEHKNGSRKPCIKSHSYAIISSPTSNVTLNNSHSSNLNTTDLSHNSIQLSNNTANLNNKTKDLSNKTMDLSNKTTDSSNKTTNHNTNEPKENSTTPSTGKDKLQKNASTPDLESTSKGNDTGKSLSPKGQGFGLPCSVVGQWISEAGGVTLKIKESQNKSLLDVEVLEQSPVKKGFLSKSWKIYGNLPFADSGNNKADGTGLGGPIVLTATIPIDKDPSENGEEKVAVFLGECRACYEGMESVVGMWSLKRISKDCLDASLSQRAIQDVFHKETNSTAKEQSKSGDNDTKKQKDSVDQNKKSHSYWRRSYNKDGKYRRYSRNNPRYVKHVLGLQGNKS